MFGSLTSRTAFQNIQPEQGASFLIFCKTFSFFCKKHAGIEAKGGKSLYNLRVFAEIPQVFNRD
jgi:hypothetical protein